MNKKDDDKIETPVENNVRVNEVLGEKKKSNSGNELPHYPESNINMQNILINSFKFFIF